MFSDECQEIENHLKSLLLMGSKTTDSSLTRETTVYENSCYPHENQRLVFRAERRNNTIFKNDHTQNLQRTSENKKQRRKFQSDFVDPRDRRSTAETRRLFSGGQNAFTGEQKREHFNSNYNNKRRQRNHKKQSDVKSEHNQCNSFYSTEFLSRVSDKDVHASAENDADFEPELFYPKYSPKSKAKESNKKSRNYFKSDNVPRTFVPQKSQAASFKDNSDQGVRTDSVNLVKERRTQANIFRNALVKTRCNETSKYFKTNSFIIMQFVN
ncbi:uncharacterized protein LOC111641383 isoform X2 [Centruroides sculpturatus]|nr:uncharacterized protein LOC111641383 isoform X2 [Centruroides sculpturatus]